MVEGKLQREGEVVHIVVQRCYNISRLLQQLLPSNVANKTTGEQQLETKKEVTQGNIFAESRNFR
jgi:error-prone DNA polymerase